MSKGTDKQNQSRYYYVSNQNMSDIKQSIEEYSMNFQKQSGIHRNSQSQIAQLISGSHPMSQSRAGVKSKTILKPQQTIKQQTNFQHEPVQQIHESRDRNKPINLGQQVYNIIRERYYQTNKVTTDDPDVLYDYFVSQRKLLSTMKPIKDEDIEKQMPSMQRKLLVKKNFQKMLTYYPDDVYYSLHLEAQKKKKDREQQYKLALLNRQTVRQRQKQSKVSKQQMNDIVQKLHSGGVKKNKSQTKINQKSRSHSHSFNRSDGKGQSDLSNTRRINQQQYDKNKRNEFGRNLSEHFQNSMRQKGHPANVETVDKLYKFWEQEDRRTEYRIQWNQDTAKMAIQQYMYEQVQDLMAYAQKKLGFKCGKAVSLFKIYDEKYGKINRIYIPINSFEEYVKVYNAVEVRKAQYDIKQKQQRQKKQQQRRKKSEAKKFGRPVSATPLSILAKSKRQGPQIQELASKYPHDKLIKTLMNEQNLKKARYAWQYGVYDLVQQVKIKQWVKIDPKNTKQNFEQNIVNELAKTFTGGNSMPAGSMMNSSAGYDLKAKDQLMSLFAEDDIYKDNQWKQYGPLLQQAMLVKAHQNPWFRDCIIKYLQKISREDNKIQTNQIIFKRLFVYINSLTEQQKMSQLPKLQRFIDLSQSIEEKTKAQKNLQKDPKKEQLKQKRLFDDMLEKKVVEFVRQRIQGKTIIERKFLNQLFNQCMKQYPEYVTKNFNVIKGEKDCPKLLKYQFYRMVKQINKVTMERMNIKKNHAWIPTKKRPQDFNYKTYNNYAQLYHKDRNVIDAQPQRQKLRKSLWGRKKGKQRQDLFMTYNDAKQCIFQPKCSKKDI